jgi:uncharacterized protein
LRKLQGIRHETLTLARLFDILSHMTREVPFRITNRSGDLIRGDLRWIKGADDLLPVIVLCHGFTAHKDWGPFPHAARKLAEYGFAVASFNFSHNGVGENPRRFTEIGRFEQNSIAKEVEDLEAVLDALDSGLRDIAPVDRTQIGLIGHSRGGGIAILTAGHHPNVSAVAGWAAVSTFYRYTEHQRSIWEAQGFLPVTIRGSQTRLRYGRRMLEDLESHRSAYDLHEAVKHLDRPLLLIHGAADVSVKPSEPESLFAVSRKDLTRLTIIEATGHAFGATHPFSLPSPVMDRVIDETARWFGDVWHRSV